MTTNAYTRLRALLPPPAVLFGKVLSHDAVNDTSQIELPLGVGSQVYATGVSVGQIITARGRSVAVGLNAFVRAGVVETQAPAGVPTEIVVGVRVDFPFGPDRLALGPAIVAPAAAMGVAYSLDLSTAWTGGYNPRAYALTSGTLPTGLALDASTGFITGTRTVAGTASGLVVTCTDTTRRAIASAAFSIA